MIRRSLSLLGVPFLKARVLILGVAFKKDIDDTRNSPALKIMELLNQRGVDNMCYNDPWVPTIEVDGKKYESQEITPEFLQTCDVAVSLPSIQRTISR